MRSRSLSQIKSMSFVWFCNFRVISVCFLWGKSVLAASLSKSCLETKNKKKQNLWFLGLFSWICFGSVKTVHSRNFQNSHEKYSFAKSKNSSWDPFGFFTHPVCFHMSPRLSDQSPLI